MLCLCVFLLADKEESTEQGREEDAVLCLQLTLFWRSLAAR